MTYFWKRIQKANAVITFIIHTAKLQEELEKVIES